MNTEFKMDHTLMCALERALARNDWTPEFVHRASDGDFLGDVRLVLMGLAKIVMNQRRLIIVDYAMNWEEMVSAGNYGWKSADFTPERFPVGSGEGKVEFETEEFWFNWNISSEKAKQEIRDADPQNPWDLAQTEHGLAYGAQHPEQQNKYPIICLGSCAEVGLRRYVLRLYRGGGDRFLFLYLNDYDAGWGPLSRFLAVRKAPVGQPSHQPPAPSNS